MDRVYWECSGKNTVGCLGTKSFRSESYFADSKMTLPEIVRLVFFYFLSNYSIRETAINMELDKKTILTHFHNLKTLFFMVFS